MSDTEEKAPVAEENAEVVPLEQAVNELAERERQQLEEPIPESIPAGDDAADEDLDDQPPAEIDQADQAAEEFDVSFDKLVAKAKRLSPDRVRPILEALLLVTDKPLSDEAIRQATGLEVATIRQQMGKLQGHYRDGVRGIVLTEVAGGWQFRTDSSVAEYVRRFLKVKPQRLTRAALETLAIIAYRQPVTRPEIEEIRACDCGAVLKALLERRLIKIIGKKEEVGRPLLYGTTKEFLEFFNLKDLASLPTLREFHELSEEHQEIVEKETGERPTIKGTVNELRDPTFEERLKASSAEADAALADLESAMAAADEKTRGATEILNPKPKPETDGDEAEAIAPTEAQAEAAAAATEPVAEPESTESTAAAEPAADAPPAEAESAEQASPEAAEARGAEPAADAPLAELESAEQASLESAEEQGAEPVEDESPTELSSELLAAFEGGLDAKEADRAEEGGVEPVAAQIDDPPPAETAEDEPSP